MTRSYVIAALVALLLVAGATEAARGGEPGKPLDAQKDKLEKAAKPEKSKTAEKPEKADKARGHGAQRGDEPIEPVASSPQRSAAPAPRRDAPSEAQASPIVPTSVARAEQIDLMFAAPGAAAVARGPTFAPGIGPADGGAEGAPWWLALLWALPLVGVGGAGTVLLLRGRAPHRPIAPQPRRAPSPRQPRMVPAAPEDLEALLRNGQGAVARGKLEEAVAWFDAALRLAPTLAVAHFCKGVCLAANGRVAEAYGALDEAVFAAPDEASYRVHFARVALLLGRPHDAMDALALVAREMPELGEAMLEDPQLAGLRDHPRFLMLCGAL